MRRKRSRRGQKRYGSDAGCTHSDRVWACARVLQLVRTDTREDEIRVQLSALASQDLSFGGYHRDDLGKDIVGDYGLNGVELGPAVEETTGWKPADRLAIYSGGSGTNTLNFLYTVREVGGYAGGGMGRGGGGIPSVLGTVGMTQT